MCVCLSAHEYECVCIDALISIHVSICVGLCLQADLCEPVWYSSIILAYWVTKPTQYKRLLMHGSNITPNLLSINKGESC